MKICVELEDAYAVVLKTWADAAKTTIEDVAVKILAGGAYEYAVLGQKLITKAKADLAAESKSATKH